MVNSPPPLPPSHVVFPKDQLPLWMFPIGMVCGNTYLMKPSERVPGCTMLLAKMLQDAGAPDGTLNIIHGQHAGECVFLRIHSDA